MLKTDPCKQNIYRSHFKNTFFRSWGQGYREGQEKEKKGRTVKKTSILYDSLSVMQNKKILSSFKDVLCCKTV